MTETGDAVLPDSSVWVAYFMGEPAARKALDTEKAVLTTPVVLAELTSLAQRGRIPLSAVEDVVHASTSVDYVEADARVAGEVHARLRRRPKAKVSLIDCMIYATARRVGADLVTTDTDLRKEPGVVLLS